MEQETLDSLLGTASGHLPVAVVSGIAGVGKTTLAIHWAHRVAGHFPDGQLFADLRGYDQHAAPATAHEVLDRFLRALGVPGEQIPTDGEERAGLFRSTLQGGGCLSCSTTRRRAVRYGPCCQAPPVAV